MESKAIDRVTFEGIHFDNRLAVSVIELDGVDIGQERVFYGKPFSIDDSGKLIATEPIYTYVDYTRSTHIESDVPPCDNIFFVSEYNNPETGECGDGYAPSWETLEGLIESL
jgi:hypothetical protein